MRTSCIIKLSKLQISKLNTLVQKETSGYVERNYLLWTKQLYNANATKTLLMRLRAKLKEPYKARRGGNCTAYTK
jgi:hypothetical protein